MKKIGKLSKEIEIIKILESIELKKYNNKLKRKNSLDGLNNKIEMIDDRICI